LRDKVQQTARQLSPLRAAFGQPLAPDDQAALDRVEAVARADTYQAFYDRLGETYTRPEALGEDLSAFHRLSSLTAAAAEVQAVKSYLDQVEAEALPPELAGELTVLQGQLNLAALADQPHLWPSVQAHFERFRGHYRNVYQIHHRDTYKAMREIESALADVPRRLQALALLDGVEALGHPLGPGLEARHTRLMDRLATCNVGVNDVRVETAPVCEVCRLRLSQQAPAEDAGRLHRDIDDALGEQLRRLKTEAIRKVLAESGTDHMDRLVRAIELSSLDSLVDVLDERLVAFIAEALEMQGVGTVPADVLQRLADKYPALEEKDVPAFLADLQALLDDAFAAARREYPDKRTIRISLK